MTSFDEPEDPLWDDPEDRAADLDEIDGVTYDPSRAPSAERWLELDEQERILLVRGAHRRLGADLPTAEQRRLHAIAHAVAENQLAADEPPEARKTLERLLRAGVNRHSAIHAIGNEIVAVLFDVLKEGKPFEPGGYEGALRSIDPQDWVHDTAGQPDV